MEILMMAIDEIKEYENNPRKNDEAVSAVADSIQNFGFKVPIIVDKNNIILILKRVLQIKGIDPNVCGPKYTFLLYSCEIGEIEIVKMLLENDNIDVNIYSFSNGNTPLITAINNKNIEIAELLIKFPKTNINKQNYQKQ